MISLAVEKLQFKILSSSFMLEIQILNYCSSIFLKFLEIEKRLKMDKKEKYFLRNT